MLKLERISTDEALRYMGQKGEPLESLKKLVLECEEKILRAQRPGQVFKVFDIVRQEEEISLLGSSLKLLGKDIKTHLEGCEKVVLTCVTLGLEVDKLIRQTEVSDISAAFVMDALASAAVEDLCRSLDEHIKYLISDSYFTWRFSPGYGDFPIEIQKDFLETLNAPKRIGLCTGENNILIPRKSVTAVMGVSKTPIPKKRRGCVCCNMFETCPYRKRGDHCGF